MRIGKILIDSDHDTHEAKVVYAKFPEDIAQRKVLLMYPIMSKYLLFILLFSLSSINNRICIEFFNECQIF